MADYVGEQALGLHGAPAGFQSIKLFLLKFLDLGIDQSFFSRLPLISIACLLAVLVLTGYLIEENRAAKSEALNPRHIIIFLAWLAGSYFGLIPWNYLPLRYFIPMIFPLAALAAVFICLIHKCNRRIYPFLKSRIFSLILFFCLTLVLYQLYQVFLAERTVDSAFWQITPYLILISLALTVLYYGIANRRNKVSMRFPVSARIIIIVCLIGGSVGYQTLKILTWARTPLFTTRQASRDLDLILSPGAVIMGSYGPALVLENDFGCIVHFMGTTDPDPDLFTIFPATHLALAQRNEKAARQFYPELMNQAVLITKYSINCEHVSLFLIAGATGNTSAAAYRPSLFEQSCLAYWRNQADSSLAYLQEYLTLYPENLSGNKRAGIFALGQNSYQLALDYFGRALEFSPTDFFLHDLAGKAYMSLAQATNNGFYREKGRAEFDLSVKYSFGRHDPYK